MSLINSSLLSDKSLQQIYAFNGAKPSATYLTTPSRPFQDAAWQGSFTLFLFLYMLPPLQYQEPNFQTLSDTFDTAPGGFHWSNKLNFQTSPYLLT